MICRILGLTLILFFPVAANSQSVSHAICSNYEGIMGSTILPWRHGGQVPIGVAEDIWNSEDQVRTRVFLKRVTRDIYRDPATGQKYLASKRFFNDCLATHRGY
jgi:hypothetical protein